MRIIYFDIDTLRADHLGCYGYHRNTSPNIDKIANEGVKFTNCFCSDAPCLPSRASLFSGRFGIHTGIVGHGGTAADMRLTGKDREFFDKYAVQNWMWRLRSSKFYTVSISPYAERHSAFWFYSGFREMFNTGKGGMEIADDVYPYAEKWLNKNGHRDNWFLHVNTWDPHTPYRTPMSFGNPFEDDPIPSWITEDIIQEHRKSYGSHSARDLAGFRNTRPSRYFKRLEGLREIRNLKDFKQFIDGYDVGIRYADEMVGKIIEIIEKLGIYDDLIIMVSSDHGESQGELNVYGDHCTADHIINRVPMIIKWPEKNWKQEYDSFIYTTDVAATMVEGLGTKTPDFWDGKTFYKEIENGEKFGRDYLVISQNAWSCQRTVRFDNWTMIRTYHTGLKNFPEIMLFDYENDFHMTTNLANDKPEVVARGIELLDKWYSEMMATSPSDIDPMKTVIEEGGPLHTRRELKGYLNWLKKSGREHLVKVILDRNEAYLS